MIHNIECSNVNYGLSFGIEALLNKGKEEASRNGPVLVYPQPVCTTYYNPRQRVLFNPVRDANPYFHLMEALWMLGGRNDVKWPAYFASNMSNYSDDSKTLNGAYGYRWRKHFKVDQLEFIVHELRKRPDSRRAVLAMWDGSCDMEYAYKGGKDAPCNTHIYFSIDKHKLDMMVMCRSNDIIWGCYGANVVHMSILQEYMAAWLGLEVGKYRQLSANFHAYLSKYSEKELEEIQKSTVDGYSGIGHTKPFKLINDTPIEEWDRQLEHFLQYPSAPIPGHMDSFFTEVACPMYKSWMLRKEGHRELSYHSLCFMPIDNDWRRACDEWLHRRAV